MPTVADLYQKLVELGYIELNAHQSKGKGKGSKAAQHQQQPGISSDQQQPPLRLTNLQQLLRFIATLCELHIETKGGLMSFERQTVSLVAYLFMLPGIAADSLHLLQSVYFLCVLACTESTTPNHTSLTSHSTAPCQHPACPMHLLSSLLSLLTCQANDCLLVCHSLQAYGAKLIIALIRIQLDPRCKMHLGLELADALEALISAWGCENIQGTTDEDGDTTVQNDPEWEKLMPKLVQEITDLKTSAEVSAASPAERKPMHRFVLAAINSLPGFGRRKVQLQMHAALQLLRSISLLKVRRCTKSIAYAYAAVPLWLKVRTSKRRQHGTLDCACRRA